MNKLPRRMPSICKKLVPAFDNLYNAMPEQQKKLTDQVFRANAEQHGAQSRHGANATAK